MKKAISSLLLAALLLAGCKSDPATTAFKVYDSYTLGLREAATIRETPGIPEEVILNLQKAASISYPGMEALAEAAIRYDTAATRIKAMQAQGLPPIPADLDIVRIATEEINGLLLTVQPLVEQLVKAVQEALH